MKLLYLVPFYYFLETRLSQGNLLFHIFFEWLSAVILVFALSPHPLLSVLTEVFIAYYAFISIYEIGYIINDLHSARLETDGRLRGPQEATPVFKTLLIVVRILAFIAITLLTNRLSSFPWWSFYFAVSLVFIIHNSIRKSGYKTITFAWLSLLRLSAPFIFLIPDSEVLGACLAASMSYTLYRLIVYLESKGLFSWPDRKSIEFKSFFFLFVLVGNLVFWPYIGFKGFTILSTYYFLIAAVFRSSLFFSRLQTSYSRDS